MSLPLPANHLLAAATGLPLTLAVGCLAAGAVLAAIGTWQRQVVLRLLSDGKRTTAVAVESQLHTPAADGSTHHVVWRFQTADGAYIEHEGLADALHHPAEHDTADNIYDPADPYNARLSTFEERTLAWALFFFSGLALLAVGALFLVVVALT